MDAKPLFLVSELRTIVSEFCALGLLCELSEPMDAALDGRAGQSSVQKHWMVITGKFGKFDMT